MSGILGTNFSGAHWRATSDRTEAIARARAARDRLTHRGADFAGDWYDDRFFLGHAEQGGLDSGMIGRLPLAANNAAITVTLDGYISNGQELRASLGKQHAFHGNGGSEVVAQAYLQWGLEGMLAKLRGSFALAVYDRDNARVCLARDALGTRPLYYLHEELANSEVGSLMFASELKALEALADESLLQVDYTAVYDYLTYRYVPAPKTLYRQVRKLPAGSCASFDLHRGYSSTQAYWQLPEPDGSLYGTEADFIEHAQELLGQAVANRLPPSLDGQNSASAASVAGICQQSSGFASWLSVNHPDVRPLTLATDDSPEVMSPAELEQLDVRSFFDEPFADVSFVARHKVLGALSASSNCALSDIGAEVLFGTAQRYRHAGGEAPGTLGWFKSKLGAGASANESTAGIASSGAVDAFNNYTRALGGLLPVEKAKQKSAWNIPDDYNDYWYFQQYYRAELPRTLRFQHLDLNTLVPEHWLTQLDRQAARHGIEARTPLLDQDLLSWLLCAPAELRGPQFDLQSVLLPPNDTSAPILARLKQSIKGAASYLPGNKATSNAQAEGTWTLLKNRFPEFDAT